MAVVQKWDFKPDQQNTRVPRVRWRFRRWTGTMLATSLIGAVFFVGGLGVAISRLQSQAQPPDDSDRLFIVGVASCVAGAITLVIALSAAATVAVIWAVLSCTRQIVSRRGRDSLYALPELPPGFAERPAGS